jgi:CheY-like chemotaxis protein
LQAGLGIPTDKLAGIFEMFSQIDRSSEYSQGGLGIGLMLVKRLVEMQGGSVEAYSEGQGRGSEFVVRLPILIKEPRAQSPSPIPELTATSRRILIVDDNQDAASSLALLLNLAGNETQTAHDGMQAIEMAQMFHPDVVLLDISLPKLSGYDVCRHIREQPWGKKMVLVALTGWGLEEDRREPKEAGFDHHLVKPMDFDALRGLLAEVP